MVNWITEYIIPDNLKNVDIHIVIPNVHASVSLRWYVEVIQKRILFIYSPSNGSVSFLSDDFSPFAELAAGATYQLRTIHP